MPLEPDSLPAAYTSSRSTFRVLFLDYDGTLTSQNSLSLAPSEEVLSVLRALTADSNNKVCLFSGRPKAELSEWFSSVVSILSILPGAPDHVPSLDQNQCHASCLHG